MAVTFKGGMHIDDHKRLSEAAAIKKLDGSDIHIYPLTQHIGAPAEPIVKIGDKVTVGQKIADSDAFVSAPVHSSVSGIVKAIEPRLHISGTTVTSIVIENDHKYEECGDIEPKKSYKYYKPEHIIGLIREAGIVGMGGAGFPTHVKLSPPNGKKIDYVIVNGAECEPYLTADHRLMVERPERVIMGLKAVMQIFNLEEGYVGIELNKQDAVDAMKKEAEKDKDKGVKIIPLKVKYPQGAEKQLIKAVTGRTVMSGKLPADAGCVVINAATASAIAEIFITGMPLVSRITTVTGLCVAKPSNFEVPLGMPVSEIVEQAGGFVREPKKLIAGGPMMGTAMFSLDVPVIKTTSGILALTDAGNTFDDSSACIRCGKCVSKCPMHLMPLYINKYARENNIEMSEKYHIMDCIECGLCSYLCPGRQHPVQSIRIMKQIINEKRRAENRR